MYTFADNNPTLLYANALEKLLKEGDEVTPRGKLVKELRPTSIEYLNPYSRVTFLGSRRINSFFQLAESLWILSGRADVEWLTKFNANMAQFSDDGKTFNGSYGERIRHWGQNQAHEVYPQKNLDQLYDCYLRLLHDKDTRQATIAIGNPSFDNYNYLVNEQGKDICCNLYITFKVRHDKLNMTVFNRSNDLHWGIFGANLCQFSTIQELMLSWLKGSGQEEYANLEMGTYHQVTDSMHIYLDSYGSDISDKVEKYYEENAYPRKEADFTCANEPRMSMNQKQFYNFMDEYWNTLDKHVSNDENVKNNSGFEAELSNLREQGKTDNYWEFAARAMYLYRCLRLGNYEMMTSTLDKLQPCQWKISLMYFMKNFVNKIENEEQAKLVRDNFEKNKQQLKENLLDKEYEKDLDAYLALA